MRERIGDPSKGLPDDVFEFVLKVVPMINVDLLVRNDAGEHLLAWRKDRYGEGWHVPGGIIRYDEPFEARISAVAEEELGAPVTWEPHPVDIKQVPSTVGKRGHFISLLFLCRMSGQPTKSGLAWIRDMPADIYPVHRMYADWLGGRTA